MELTGLGSNAKHSLVTEMPHYSLSLILFKSQEVNIPLYSLSPAIRALLPHYSSQGLLQSQGTMQHLLSHFLYAAFNSQYTETQPASAITVSNFKLFLFFLYMLQNFFFLKLITRISGMVRPVIPLTGICCIPLCFNPPVYDEVSNISFILQNKSSQ